MVHSALVFAALVAIAEPVTAPTAPPSPVTAAAPAPAAAPSDDLASEPALSLPTRDDVVAWHGFGEWLYARTNDNEYSFGTPDGNFRNVEVALAILARPEPNVTVGAQGFFAQHGEETEPALDWAFAEWQAADWARARAGRIKQPVGLFFEVKDVGTVRAFLKLPASVYAAGFGAEAVDGAGLTGNLALGDWSAGYDLYGGIVSLEPNRAWVAEGSPMAEMTLTNLFGTRLRTDSPFGTTVMLSGYQGTHQEEGTRQTVGGASLEQHVGPATVRGEYFWKRHQEDAVERGWYGEAELRAFERWQVAVRWDQHDGGFYGRREAFEDQLHHQELAAGLSYWVAPELVARVSFHRASGGRFIRPAEEEGESEAAGADEAPEAPAATNLVMTGVQFSF